MEPMPRRRTRKRWVIPLFLLGLLALAALFVYVRGTWADPAVVNPTTSAQGILVQLYQTPDGRKEVRGAVILDAPPTGVWQVVTDYPNQDQIFRYVSKIEVQPDANGSHHLNGIAHSRLWGDWPYEVHVFHDEQPESKTYRAYWDEPGGAITVNRGSWTVTPAGSGTLLVFTLEVEVGDYPTFLIRNLLLDRFAKIVADVQEAVRQRASSP